MNVNLKISSVVIVILSQVFFRGLVGIIMEVYDERYVNIFIFCLIYIIERKKKCSMSEMWIGDIFISC